MVSITSAIRRMDKWIILLFLIYFFLYFGMSCYSPYINLYFMSRGMSTGMVGVLSTVLPLTALVFPSIWANLADKTQNAKLFEIILIAGSGGSALLYLVGFNFFSFVGITVLYAVFATCVGAMLDVVAITICQRLQYKFSFIRISGTLGYAIGCLVLSNVISNNLHTSFIFLAVFYTIALILFLRLPKISPPLPVNTSEGPEKLSLFANKAVIFALFLLMTVYMAASFYNSFLGILLQNENMPSTFLGFCMFLSALGEVPVLFLAPKLVERFGEIKLMVFSSLVMTIRMILVTTGSIPIIILLQCIQGWSYMLNFYCGAMLIDRLVHPKLKTQGQSIINTVQVGVGSVLGNIIGGALSESIGLSSTYRLISFISLGITVLTMTIFFFFKKREPTLKT